MVTAIFHKVVEEIEQLNLEEKEHIRDLTDKMIAEARREEIKRNGEEAVILAQSGQLKFGSAKDVIARLSADI